MNLLLTVNRPVLDVYIKNHLKSIRAHSHLITCLKTTFDKLNTQQSSKAVMPTLKVGMLIQLATTQSNFTTVT